MEKQMDLFNISSKDKKDKLQNMNPADKAYYALIKDKNAKDLHIYEGGGMCNSIALDYVNGCEKGFGETTEAICKRSAATKSHHYYHYVNHQFIEYNAWILNQIKHCLDSKNSQQTQATDKTKEVDNNGSKA